VARAIFRHDLGCSPLLVIPRSRPGEQNTLAHHWLNRRRVAIHAAQGRLYTQIRSLYRLGGRVLTLLFKFWTLCFWAPPLGGLRTTYDVHLELIGKRVVDFLLVLIELFMLVVTAVTGENRSKIGDFAPTQSV